MRRLIPAAGALAVLSLAACSGAVRVDPPTPAGAAASACQKLATALPSRLDGAERVESEPRSPYVAVWGAGEIALRCGVDRPASMAATDQVSDLDGVAWYADPKLSTLFTAINREAYVEVTVSGKHVPGEVLVDLAGPIKSSVPE
ncbi:DUF3515 domain-containing protein [Microtetraspora sp. AC03309]|uniref:DUF3515 domain-containing protein n=1 Tax=Microtetraspora sp. AC03309 TaxID=2779376 RepID=UPI001E50C211|nr:DUF3515 domain-containing protein [Microtetraspora sp. AC03309]MCC5576760.1 DUF3515 domain-containing protein [Microtetraspora sp. AC03309]